MNVSIVIPANKDRGWLNQAIESALNQDYTGSYEVILASDGNYSLKKYADRYGIRFSLASKNNLAHNVNVALQMADGEFIKGLAEDDLLAPNCLSDLTRCIGNNDLVYARAFNFKGDMEKISISEPPKEITLEKVFERCCIHGGTTLYRKDVFWAVGGRDERLSCAEEWDFYLNLLVHGYKFTFCDAIVYKYRRHDQQKSTKDKARRTKDKNYIRGKYKKYLS